MNIADQLATVLHDLLHEHLQYTGIYSPDNVSANVTAARAVLDAYEVHPIKGMKLYEPVIEAWCSTDSCSEHWGWEPVAELDERTMATLDPQDFRIVFVARAT